MIPRIKTLPFFMLILIFFLASCGGTVSTTPDGVPTIPVAINPADSSVSVAVPVLLQWFSNGALLYDVYFGTSQNPQLISENSNTSFFQIPQALVNAGGLYYWKIVAKGLSGSSESAVWKFTTAYEEPAQGQSEIEISDVSAFKSSIVQQNINGYSLTQVRGLDLTLSFDETYLGLPQNLENAVDLAGSFSGGLKIVTKPQSGKINISVSFTTPVNINSEQILNINFQAKGISGISQVSIDQNSKIIDLNFNEIVFGSNDTGIVILHD